MFNSYRMDQYSLIDWNKAANIMRNPAWVFDTRLIADEKQVKDANLFYWRLGDGL